MLRDIQRGKDDQIAAVIAVIAHAHPDVLVLTQIDYDLKGEALAALAKALAQQGAVYPHHFVAAPNAGARTGLDMDSDGRLGPRDAQGYGRFPGDGGMAVLSRYPVSMIQDLTPTLWRDVVGANTAVIGPAPVQTIARVSSIAHWHLRIDAPTPIDLLTMAATPPVFDGPEDRNGHRNVAELLLWVEYLRDNPLDHPFVLAGELNVDPQDGDGRDEALIQLMQSGLVQDPKPRSAGGLAAADPKHRGDPGLDTTDWPGGPNGPGNLRVDYVLPSSELQVLDAGVVWPDENAPLGEISAATVAEASAHRLVWVDLQLGGDGKP